MQPDDAKGLPMSLQAKLGALIVHAQEFSDEKSRHAFDLAAIQQLANDAEVTAWLATIPEALLPVKR